MSAASGGFSPARLQRLHAAMAGYVERGEVPGIVTLVSRRGEVHVDAVGHLAGSDEAVVARDSIFRISSMTKPVTAAAAMLLVEEGKLRLDEPVDRLLPELAGRRVLKQLSSPLDETEPARRAITVRDLLTFRLGWGVVMAPPDTYPIQRAMSEQRLGQGPPLPQVPPAPDEWMRRLGTMPLMHQPGERWMYSTGSDVLGVLIERAAGQPFERFLDERLFAPLGMRDTAFFVPPAKIDRLAAAYCTNFATRVIEQYDAAADGQWSQPPAFPSGAGGLVSTIDDFAAFSAMMLSKGRCGTTRILSRPAVELMTTDHLTAAQKAASNLPGGYFESHGYGFGLGVRTRRDELAGTVGSFGWDGGLGTSWRVDPAEELFAILMTQQAWTSPSPPNVCRDFWTLIYQAIDD